jgi:cysteine desulfurase
MAIYLDYNATAPIRREVVEAMVHVWKNFPGNPASQHQFGRAARKRLEEARDHILDLLGAKPTREGDRLIFTSGGTEANNLAILGIALARTEGMPGRIIISSIEHPSVLRAAETLVDWGWRLDTLDVHPNGVVNVESLRRWIDPQVALVSVTTANHETGVIQPIAEIAAICHSHGVPFHTDAVQAVGKMPVSFRDFDADAMTVTPHKFGGPLGIGALIVTRGTPLRPILFGGEQQDGLRPGTESVALAVGMETALALAVAELQDNVARMTALRQEFEQTLKALIPDLIIHGEEAPRLPQTVNLAIPGIDNQFLFTALDLERVCCSIGSACSSGSPEPSPSLLALGIPREIVKSSLRVSFGPKTTAEELRTAAHTIARVSQQLRKHVLR